MVDSKDSYSDGGQQLSYHSSSGVHLSNLASFEQLPDMIEALNANGGLANAENFLKNTLLDPSDKSGSL